MTNQKMYAIHERQIQLKRDQYSFTDYASTFDK